jgi:hypothetical protein
MPEPFNFHKNKSSNERAREAVVNIAWNMENVCGHVKAHKELPQ